MSIFQTYEQHVMRCINGAVSRAVLAGQNLGSGFPLHHVRINSTYGTVVLEATGPLSWGERADMLRAALRVVEAEAERPSATYPV